MNFRPNPWLSCLMILLGGLSAPSAGAPPAAPFTAGEVLKFEVRWRSPLWLFFIPTISAGTTTFEAQKVPELLPGKELWRLTARAESSSTLSSLTGMKVDDYFESWMDPQELCSYRIFKKIREGKRRRDVEVTFDRESGCMRLVEMDAGASPPKKIRELETGGLPSCVQDILSIFYSSRFLTLEAGRTYTFTVSDNGRTRDIEAEVEKEEIVETPIGSMPAWRVRTRAVFGGLFREGGELLLWFHKERHYPVRFDAKVKLGRILGRITSYAPQP